MSENESRGECFLEKIESITIGEVKLSSNILLDKVCQWNDNVQVVKDELAIKICET